MFLTLGLLVFPSRLWPVAGPGLAIALWLVVLARPIAALACLKPFGFSAREITYISGVGLRGAVPIILAAYPVLAHVPGSDRIFHVVFFVVVVSVLLQGTTARPLTLALRLGVPSPPTPPAVLEMVSRRPLSGELSSYFIHPEAAVSGIAIREIPFPDGAAVILVVRDTQLIPANGDTVLEPGDHAYVLCGPRDRSIVQLLFGRGED
jgi:cell volume regulation protein A